MAGIQGAMKRVMEHRNLGKVLVRGTYREGNETECPENKYMIVRLSHDNGTILVLDYGSDVRIADDVEDGKTVMLNILDNWTAEWQIHEPGETVGN